VVFIVSPINKSEGEWEYWFPDIQNNSLFHFFPAAFSTEAGFNHAPRQIARRAENRIHSTTKTTHVGTQA
jgi:hypothetical protein